MLGQKIEEEREIAAIGGDGMRRGPALAGETTVALEAFRFDDMAAALYRFLWHEYCDWYVEMSKPCLVSGALTADAARTRAVLLHVLESVLRLLHPVMPFLTEDIWQRLPHAGETIALTPWPAADAARLDPEAEHAIDLIMEVVGRVRNLRAEIGLDPGQPDMAAHLATGGKAVFLRNGEMVLAEGSNEIPAIPALLELLELNGALVSIDAIGTQKDIAAQIA